MISVIMSTEKWRELLDWMAKQSIETLDEFPIKSYEIYDYKTTEDLVNIIEPMIEVSNIKSQRECYLEKAKEADPEFFGMARTSSRSSLEKAKEADPEFFGMARTSSRSSKECVYQAANAYANSNNLRIVIDLT